MNKTILKPYYCTSHQHNYPDAVEVPVNIFCGKGDETPHAYMQIYASEEAYNAGAMPLKEYVKPLTKQQLHDLLGIIAQEPSSN